MYNGQASSSQLYIYIVCRFVGDTSWFGERFEYEENFEHSEFHISESIPMRDRVAPVRGNVR